MPTDAPESPGGPRRQAALMLAPVLLIALGLPYALHLPARAAAAVTVGVLAAATLAASSMRRAFDTRGGADAALPVDLIAALPQAAVLLVDGRVRAANASARALLGLHDTDMHDADPSAWFGERGASRTLLHGPSGDHEATLRRGDTRIDVQVCARELGGRQRLLLIREADNDLAARVEAQRAELQTLARRLMTVQEDERAAISRELHDDIGQAITAIKLCATSLAEGPEPMRQAVVLEMAQEIATVADQTVAKLRDLSLLLRPPQLDALGLEAALRWQAGALFRGDLPRIELDIPPLDCRPPRDVELACFRIAQEALTNVLRHARAGRVALHLRCDDTDLRLRIEDDGCGIAADHRAGLGLITMRERARLVGGALTIDSRPGRTRIDVVLPLPEGGDARSGLLQG